MKIGFIDYYLDEWHANNYPRMLASASDGEMQVTLAFGLIDSPIGGRTTEKWCADMGIPKAQSIEEVCESCDAIIVLSPDNCEMHESLCQIPLKSGKRVYVDKTFAPDYAAAKRIFDIAELSGTPCYSTSALRYADEYKGIGEVNAIASVGPYGFETYAIHQLEPIMMLIKQNPTEVCYVPGNNSYSLIIRFEGGKTATIVGFNDDCGFAMELSCEGGHKSITVNSDYFGGFIKQLVNFFKTGEGAVPHDETLRIMAVRGAGLKASQNPGEWVKVEM